MPTPQLAVEPFEVHVSDDIVSDLRDRLARTRWPDELPGVGWNYGTPRALVQELCEHWRTIFDWRAFEARHNRFPQFVTSIDGQRIHFVHARVAGARGPPLAHHARLAGLVYGVPRRDRTL